jgi:hypothetical protein
MYEEGAIDKIKSAPPGQIDIEHAGFKMQDICGRDEMPEGHFILESCPACGKPGAEVERSAADDPLPLGEVITDPDLDPEDQKALATALVS